MWHAGIYCIHIVSFLICSILHPNARDKGLLLKGFSCTAIGSVYAIMQNVTVYPSTLNPRDFTLFNDNASWLEANSRCQEIGGSLLTQRSSSHSVYVKSAALKNGWPPYKPIWFGALKFKSNDTWIIKTSACKGVTNWEINKAIPEKQQCLLLNMTTENTQKTNLYAASCDTKTGYLCAHQAGSIYEGDGYAYYENMTLAASAESRTISDNVSSLFDCVYQLFKGCFACYAAEFHHPLNICRQFKMDTASLPHNVSITESSNYQTLILSRTNRVNISDDIIIADESSESDLSYPCQSLADEISTVSTQKTCYCKCTTSFVNRTIQEIQSEIDARKKELQIEKKILSAHLRRKTCAVDDRISAGTMGYIGGLVLSIVIFFLVINDVIMALRLTYTVFIERCTRRQDKH